MHTALLILVIALYLVAAALSLVGLIAPARAAKREAGFAERARMKHDNLHRHWMEVAGGPELADEQDLRKKALDVAMGSEFENSGKPLRWWVETTMFDHRASNAYAARTAYAQSKVGLKPVALGLLAGAAASLLSLFL